MPEGLEAEADVNAELARILAERNTGTEPTAPEGTPPATPATPTTPVTEPAAPAAPSPATDPATPAGQPAEPELVTLSAATYTALTEAARTITEDRRRRVLDDAVRAGRIAPAERGKLTSELAAGETVSGFAAALERDEAGTTTLLGQLAPRFAVSELGEDAAPTAHAADEAYDRFEAETFGVTR